MRALQNSACGPNSMRSRRAVPHSCPACGSSRVVPVMDLGDVPIFCNVRWHNQADALAAPRAPFELVGCDACGHQFNAAFDPGRVEYTEAYDNSQHFSAVFRDYAAALAERLVAAHGLGDVDVVDVGCGSGDLLALICASGRNRGHGFDTSLQPDAQSKANSHVTFVNDFFTPAYAQDIRPALVCCRHVLEHVAEPRRFLAELRRTLEFGTDAVLYLEVPNGALQCRQGVLWDYIYEHFSYFTPESLRRLLMSSGFEILRLETAYADQFICADVRVGRGSDAGRPPEPQPMREGSDDSGDRLRSRLAQWRRWAEAQRGTTVLWGAGSKGASFLNFLGLRAPAPVGLIVDQNPRKQGGFVGGTGQLIVPPEGLLDTRPDTVVIMNAVYRGEIADWLAAHYIDAVLVDAMAAPPVPAAAVSGADRSRGVRS